jgi:hypothetical protein
MLHVVPFFVTRMFDGFSDHENLLKACAGSVSYPLISGLCAILILIYLA